MEEDGERDRRVRAATLAMRGRLPGWMLRELELDEEDIREAVHELGLI